MAGNDARGLAITLVLSVSRARAQVTQTPADGCSSSPTKRSPVRIRRPSAGAALFLQLTPAREMQEARR